MFLVMGITGKVGGATADHLLAHRKEVRASFHSIADQPLSASPCLLMKCG